MKLNQAHRPRAGRDVNIYLILKLKGKEFMLVAVREERKEREAEEMRWEEMGIANDARGLKRDACRRNG
jgi:hypothetical protein